jgi:flagellar biosynthetic protein FliR
VNLALDTLVMQLAAVGLRVGGAFTFMPFLGSSAIPARVKAVLVVLVAAVIFPHVSFALPPHSASTLAQIGLSEAMLGLLMGLSLQFVFEAVQLAGQVSGFQMSFSLVNIIDPQSNVETPVLANLHQLVVLLLFLQLNVHHWILLSIQKSFVRVPPGCLVFSADQVRAIFHAAAGMWVAGLQLAAPLLLATVVLDITVGFVSKAAPQLPVLFLSIPLKSLLGYMVLALALGLWPEFFQKQFGHALEWSWRLVELTH